jgi:MYXO-CTERM domain-containing protein
MNGMGGLAGHSFNLDNTGWFTSPTLSPNTTFNGGTGDHEALIMQLTVNEGVGFELDNVVVTYSTATSPKLAVSTVPAPGALALLGLAGFTARRRRR